MKRLLLLLFVSAMLISCQSETNNSETVIHSDADSKLYTLEGENFTAELSQANSNSRGKADGPFYWERFGPLPYLLSELYQAPVEMEGSPNLDYHYELVVTWEEETLLENIRQNIADKTKETFGYEVNANSRMQPRYVLSINDMSMLQKDKGSDTVQPNFTSKVTMQNNNWDIYSTLDKFADILSENTNQKVITKEDYGSTIYYFDLSYSGGFDSLIAQLEENYGLDVQKEMVSEEYYTISFK
jgi:hypothetical protein